MSQMGIQDNILGDRDTRSTCVLGVVMCLTPSRKGKEAHVTGTLNRCKSPGREE